MWKNKLTKWVAIKLISKHVGQTFAEKQEKNPGKFAFFMLYLNITCLHYIIQTFEFLY